MFPLGAVIFPHTHVPLRVFEPRYQHLLDDVLASDRSLGTVLIERGPEVGGGDQRFDVGTRLLIASVGRLPEADQRQIVVTGDIRIRIERWLSEEPYPSAVVSEWPDEAEDVAPRTLEAVRSGLMRVAALAGELGLDTGGLTTELADDPLAASYQAAALTPVTPLDSYSLLTAPGPDSRLQLCIRLLADCAEDMGRQLGS